MIISHKHKFIFLKTKKTAGTSIEIALSKICGPDDIITPITKGDEIARKEFANRSAQNYHIPINRRSISHFVKSIALHKRIRYYNHMPAQDVRYLVKKEIWDSYYKFTVERNPFDKMVSLYFWKKGDQKFGNTYDFLTKGGLNNFLSYDIYAINGVVAVDKVYDYGDLDTMCRDLTTKFQLSEPLEMPNYKAKSVTRKVKKYDDLLDKKSIEQIKIIFAREIALMNYKY